MDTGAGGYLFISLEFARRVLKLLQPRCITGFKPYPVGGYHRKSQQTVDVALQAALCIIGRTEFDSPITVLDMHHNMILGLKWFGYHNIKLDPCRRRLEFPPKWRRGPPLTDIPMDETGQVQQNVEWNDDVLRRDAAMDLEDQRRAAGRASKPVPTLRRVSKLRSAYGGGEP